MKTLRIVILLVAISTLGGCKFKKEAEQLEMEKQELTAQLEKCDATLRQYRSLIIDFETNLNEILPEDQRQEQSAAEQGVIARINQTMAEIKIFQEESEQRNQALRYRNTGINSRITTLETEIQDLNLLIEEKDSMINISKDRITGLSNTIEERSSELSELSGENKTLNEELEARVNQLNTAYFIIGAEDDLRDKNIIMKSGGFLGFLGQVNSLSPQIDESQLEMIDIRNKKSFTLNTEIDNVEFITHHPSESYNMEQVDEESVQITVNDPDTFWQISKYLIIAI